MRQKSVNQKPSSERIVKDIRRATRKHYSAEEKIRIVLDGLRGEHSIAELCRREGIAEGLYYSWSKEFLEAGKRRLAGRHGASGDQRRGQGPPPRGPGAEGGRRRAGAGIAAAQKKHDRGWGRRGMRYPASEKLEIIRLVEQSHLPARRTLEMLGILRSTFYRWYDRYQAGGPEALEDQPSTPRRVWNRIPDEVRERIVDLALDEPELSPRELATRFTDTESYFVSEASVYRLLKAHDLITSPAFIVMKAADEFKDKTTAPNQLWQTDFTYLKVIGWGWFYLSTILDDFSRYIIAWKLCTTMKAEDVTDTLELALDGIRLRSGAGRPQTTAAQRQRLQLHLRRSGKMARGAGYGARPRRALSSPDPGQDRALAPDAQEPHPARELLPAWRSRSPDRRLRRSLQSPALPREPAQPDTGRRLLRARPNHPAGTRKDQTRHHPKPTIAASAESRLT